MRSLLDEYVEGIRYLRKQPDVLMITIQKGAVALTMGGAFVVVQVSIANQMSFAGIN